jgi:hypothetical protein
MNSHQRRKVERRWPHAVNVLDDDAGYVDEVFLWLGDNLGSKGFTRRRKPRWCYRTHYSEYSSFARIQKGVQIYFRNDKDYAWILLRWDQ